MDLAILLGGLAAVLLLFWQGTALRIMPVPTRRNVRAAALALVRGLDPAHVVELGSGWGGMAAALVRAFPRARVRGYERSVLPYALSRLCGRPVVRGDIFAADLSQADIVFCYLSPWHMQALAPKFARELKDGAVVVSAAFDIPGMTPQDRLTAPGMVETPVYLYRFRK